MLPESRTYKPELLPRRGEIVAWILTIIAWAGAALLMTFGVSWPWAILFPCLLLLAAASISLGNWMDRRTVLQMDAQGVAFENGVRNVRLGWGEIAEVIVIPAVWGETIHVVGKASRFRFNTLGEVRYQGELRGRTGFVRGNEIFQTVLKMSALRLAKSEDGWRRFVR